MALCDRLEAAQTERESRRDRLVAASLHRLNNGARSRRLPRPRPLLLQPPPAPHHPPGPHQATPPNHPQPRRPRQTVPQDPNDEPASELLERIESDKRAFDAGRWDTATDKRPLIPPGVLSTFRHHGGRSLSATCAASSQVDRAGGRSFTRKSGPSFVRAQNIRFGRLKLDDLACVNPPVSAEGTRTQIAAADLLIVITGAGVTNPAMVERDLGEAYVSQHVGLVRPIDAGLSPWLLLCLMADRGGRAELVERAYGAGKPGLNLDNIRSLTIPLPPFAEQQRIVAKVNDLMALCDALEASLTATTTARTRLLDATLREALTA